jgi:hypothetical protein
VEREERFASRARAERDLDSDLTGAAALPPQLPISRMSKGGTLALAKQKPDINVTRNL